MSRLPPRPTSASRASASITPMPTILPSNASNPSGQTVAVLRRAPGVAPSPGTRRLLMLPLQHGRQPPDLPLVRPLRRGLRKPSSPAAKPIPCVHLHHAYALLPPLERILPLGHLLRALQSGLDKPPPPPGPPRESGATQRDLCVRLHHARMPAFLPSDAFTPSVRPTAVLRSPPHTA